MKAPTDNLPVTVNLLVLPESTPAVLYGLFEVFSAVGGMWRQLTGEDATARRMETRLVAREATSFSSVVGPPIAPDTSLADSPRSDVIIVTDLTLSPDLRPGGWEAEIAWLRRHHELGALVCSVCTGSVLLAEAGLLDGLEATTHWSAASLFRERYPAVRLHPERILCPAGGGHSIITSGGPGSWEDLALSLIARFSGKAEATRIAKIFVLGDRSDGQLVFSAMGRPRSHNDAIVSDCQAWVADNYSRLHPVFRMVQRSGLPERTFKRRFKAATGYAPVEYVQALRIEEAKQILETTSEPTDGVAQMVGYDDPAFFRRLFKRRTGVTPARYRKRFGVMFDPDRRPDRSSSAPRHRPRPGNNP